MSGDRLEVPTSPNGRRPSQDAVGAMDHEDLPADEAFLFQVLLETLEYARKRDYTGYDYFDGMSSRVLKMLPVDNKWVNIAVQESIKRAPVNIRPYLLVEQRQNFKGTALFSMANETAYALSSDERYREESRALVDWLIKNKAEGYAGFCGGHTHEMQQLDERRPANTPNVVPTSYGVKALLRAAAYEEDYGTVARTAASFVEEDLNYTESDTGARIVYQPYFDGEFYTLNGGALGARIHVDLYEAFGDPVYLERAQKLLDHIATKQADIGGWKYRDPPSASHLSMDNHHNGFVLEAYLRYQEVVSDDRYSETIERALAFHRESLFDADGAPNWDETKAYPKDIHAATQGIIVFSKAGDFTFARKIIDWVFANLYAGEGEFYYQKRRFYTKQFTLMRWCQAWMAYAISVYFEERHVNGGA
ncbi:hypothetical protein [Haloarcula marismortui]|uniref:Antibiotic ABC transporter permease n=2 Tax=Haloarcula marismortui ATCC 33800 TaxID=662476 RepID=M0JK76_9EURY|nr:hypothetical protein [Haloarcula sinaiiensis]EMA08753.1 hypothetical protein C436_20348 [Haloarcula sinaiiensis ATCC 33800]